MPGTYSHPPLKVGVSSCFFHADPTRPLFKGKTLLYAEESMLQWLLENHAIPFLLPRLGPTTSDGISLTGLLRELDGLLLQGGADVAPGSYGETALQEEWGGDPLRDCYERALIKEAMQLQLPILGICRGHQILNVACGGTLWQDTESQCPGTLGHRRWDTYDQNQHQARIIPNSGLAKIYPDQQTIVVNSIHHQAIKDLAPGFQVECRSEPDGIIEAIRWIQDPSYYCVGIQWHPEFQPQRDRERLPREPIMKEFIAAMTAKRG